MVGHGQRGAPGGLGVLLGMGVPLVAGGGQGYGVLLGYGVSPKVWAALRDMGGSWGMGGSPKVWGTPKDGGVPQEVVGVPQSMGVCTRTGGSGDMGVLTGERGVLRTG